MAPSPGVPTPPRTSYEAPRLSSAHSTAPSADPSASRSGTPGTASRSRPTTPLAALNPKGLAPGASIGAAPTTAPSVASSVGAASSVAVAPSINSASARPMEGFDAKDPHDIPVAALEAAAFFADRLSRANTIARRPPPINPPPPPAVAPSISTPDAERGGGAAGTGGGGGGAGADAPAQAPAHPAEEAKVETVETAAPGGSVGIPLVDDALDAQVNPPSLERSSLGEYATAADHWLLTESRLEQYEEFVARGLLMVRNMARSDPRYAVTAPSSWLAFARDCLSSKHGLIRAAAASAVAAFAASTPGRDAIQKDPLALSGVLQMLTQGIAAGCDNTDAQYASLALANISLNACMRLPLIHSGALQRAADVMRAAIRLLGGGVSVSGGGAGGAAAPAAASGGAAGGGGGNGAAAGGSTNAGAGGGGAGRKAAALLKAASYIVTLLTCLSVGAFGRDQLETHGLMRLVSELHERSLAGLGPDHMLSRRLALMAETWSAAELLDSMEEGGVVMVAGSGGGHAVAWDLAEDIPNAPSTRTVIIASGGGGGGGSGGGAAVSLQRGVSFADGLRGAAASGRATAAISALQKLVDPEGARAAAESGRPTGLLSQVSMAARSMSRKASMAASVAAAAASAAATSAAASFTPRGGQGHRHSLSDSGRPASRSSRISLASPPMQSNGSTSPILPSGPSLSPPAAYTPAPAFTSVSGSGSTLHSAATHTAASPPAAASAWASAHAPAAASAAAAPHASAWSPAPAAPHASGSALPTVAAHNPTMAFVATAAAHTPTSAFTTTAAAHTPTSAFTTITASALASTQVPASASASASAFLTATPLPSSATATGAFGGGGRDGRDGGGGGGFSGGISIGGGGSIFLSQRNPYINDNGLSAISLSQSMFGPSSPPSPPQPLPPPPPPPPSSSMLGVHFAASIFTDAVAARNALMAEELSSGRRRSSMPTYLTQLAQSSKSVKLPSVVGFNTGASRNGPAGSDPSPTTLTVTASPGSSQGAGQPAARAGSARSAVSLAPTHAHLASPQASDDRGGGGAARPRSGISMSSLRSHSALGDLQKQRLVPQPTYKGSGLTDSGYALAPSVPSGGMRSACSSPLMGRQEPRFELPFHLVRGPPPGSSTPPPVASSKGSRLTGGYGSSASASRRPSASGNSHLHGFSRMYTSDL